MNKQILDVVASVSMEKGVDKTIIFQALEEAISSATKKLVWTMKPILMLLLTRVLVNTKPSGSGMLLKE